MVSWKTMAAPDEKRVAAETSIFDRYNKDGLFSLPHQKDPSIPRPSWFQDPMLVPGPRSIGQKLITVSRYRAQNAAKNVRIAAARRAEQQQTVNHRGSLDAATESTVPTQATPDRTAEETIATEGDPLHSNGTVNSEFETTQAIPKPRQLKGKPEQLKDLEIHIGTILELDTGLLKM
jgi:hypothetical protein